jgi:molecular chaperone GrpE
MSINKTEDLSNLEDKESLKESIQSSIEKEDSIKDEDSLENDNNSKKEANEKELLEKINYLEDQLKRALADFLNYKKRIEKEAVQNVFLEKSKIILEFISFKEVLEKAIEHETEELFKKNIVELNNNFKNILKRLEVKKIELINTEYDYNLAECIQTIKTEDRSKHNKVIEVLENGYTYKEELIKPAKVIIGKFMEE